MGELVGRRAINSHHDEGSPAPCACCSPDYWARWPWWHGWLRHGRVWIRLRDGRFGYGMGGSGYGGEWSEWKPTGGYGGGECCPTKKIWGSMNPEKDGFYDLVVDENMMQNMMENGYGMGSGEGMNSRYGGNSISHPYHSSWYYSYLSYG